MLKDEIQALNDERQRKLKIKENRKNLIKNVIHNTFIYKAYQRFLEINNKFYNIRYENKTQKIIRNLPKKLKRLAKKYDSADIHQYEYSFFISIRLANHMASYYMDKRGRDIIQYLKDNDIKYYLHTHNDALESYYTIRVVFNE